MVVIRQQLHNIPLQVFTSPQLMVLSVETRMHSWLAVNETTTYTRYKTAANVTQRSIDRFTVQWKPMALVSKY